MTHAGMLFVVYCPFCAREARVMSGRKRVLRSISGGTSSICKTNQPYMEIKIDFLLNRILPTLTLRQQ